MKQNMHICTLNNNNTLIRFSTIFYSIFRDILSFLYLTNVIILLFYIYIYKSLNMIIYTF